MNELVRLAGPRRTRPSLARLCAERFAVRLPGALSPDACETIVRRVVAARRDWTSNFGGVQFTLGRAWYTHLEEGREEEYFRGAPESDACVEAHLPGMQEKVLGMVSDLVGATVTRRPGYCGPGVHIFPAGSEVARIGGAVHFDTEGLTDAQCAARAPAFSIVLMLQMPASGGGLTVWDDLYAGEDFPERPGPDVPSVSVTYRAGELVVFDSYRLHQIMPFAGDVDRVSITAHVVKADDAWEAWF
jgi:hypothetical protein